MATNVPKLQWKYMTEGNPFGRKIMINVADVVAWIVANFDGDKDQIPELKFITAGKTLCERQIANLSEVVQAIFDNMADSAYTEVDTAEVVAPEEGTKYCVKDAETGAYVPGGVTDQGEWDSEADAIYVAAEGVIAPEYAYATETTKPMAVLYIENMPKVVGEIYKQMFPSSWTEEDEYYFNDGNVPSSEESDEEEDGKPKEEDTPAVETVTKEEYEQVDTSEVSTPVEGTTYYVSGDDGYEEADTTEGWPAGKDVFVKKTYVYTKVDKTTSPVEGTQYYVSDGNGGFTEGGLVEEGEGAGSWVDEDVYTRAEA